MSTLAFSNEGDLSKSTRAWDLDGDGKLDDAELALKNLDQSHKGTLSKEQMYGLMKENLKTQHELFKMKKVVIGLSIVTFILSLSNLGTSFAAAILSKDTTTSGGVLIDKHTGQVVKTDSRVNNYKSDPDATERLRRQRRLECVTETGTDGHADLDCSFNSDVISSADALLMLSQCHDGNDVHFEYPNADGKMIDHHICPTDEGEFIHVEEADGTVTSGTITHDAHTFTFAPNPANSDEYIITTDHTHLATE